ncbi:phosphotransferase family protein [Actinoplanes siamensis]
MRGLVTAHLPGYRVESIDLIGAGTDHTAFEINSDLIVRLSKSPDPDRTEREARLLTTVRGVAPLPVPEPVFVAAEHGCLAYRKLPGTPLLNLPAPGRPERIAATLGEFLAALHTLPASLLAGLVDTDAQPPAEWLDEAAETYDAVAGHLPARHRPLIERFLGTAPPPGPETLAFSHNDLGIEHVLADPRDGAITGVIDWGDAALTDPAYDFGLLFRDLGPAALSGLDPARRERAVFYARCGLLEDLAYGIESGQRRYADRSLAALSWVFPATTGPPPRARSEPAAGIAAGDGRAPGDGR